MYIHKENLIIALETAIADREKYEREVLKYTGDSALVAGWKDTVKALNNGEDITIIQ